ncbi:exodeoxyribonuclease VII small subunit [beta proteobacterium MWH-UniP1]
MTEKNSSKRTNKAGVNVPETADLEGLSFEQAMAQIEQVVAQLEQPDVPLAESLAAYQRGAALMRHAQAILNQVQTDIDIIESGKTSRVGRSDMISQIKE